ncbi:MAG: SMP-30/gluconolactonase/LRE family protein [Rhizobiales bacterium]|nr:SMP-30/gluconolactonase/LRE family protein [Hyphomicrobiales bacterium]
MTGRECRLIADGLGWPEGPTRLPDGRIAFVESYRSRVSVLEAGKGVICYADVGGGPNAALAAADGCVYVTQNGGKIGPWRAERQMPPSIQRIDPQGRVEILAEQVEGHRLVAPNDLVFGPDGWLYFTDPGGAYDPVGRANRGFLCALAPDGTGVLLEELPPTFPNGIVAEEDGSIVWVESYTRAVRRRRPDGRIEDLAVLPAPVVPDGLKRAANGDFYVTGVDSGTVEIVAADGTPRGRLAVGRVPTNCLFDGTALYVTDGGRPGLAATDLPSGALWRLELDGIAGAPLFDGSININI